jgi:hypothetical protein
MKNENKILNLNLSFQGLKKDILNTAKDCELGNERYSMLYTCTVKKG